MLRVNCSIEPLGQLSSRTQFTKINNKKVIAENQCEKHKKSSLGLIFFDAGYILLYCGTTTFWQKGLLDSCFQNPSESSE